MTTIRKAAENNNSREFTAEELDRISGGWGVGVFFGAPASHDNGVHNYAQYLTYVDPLHRG